MGAGDGSTERRSCGGVATDGRGLCSVEGMQRGEAVDVKERAVVGAQAAWAVCLTNRW